MEKGLYTILTTLKLILGVGKMTVSKAKVFFIMRGFVNSPLKIQLIIMILEELKIGSVMKVNLIKMIGMALENGFLLMAATMMANFIRIMFMVKASIPIIKVLLKVFGKIIS